MCRLWRCVSCAYGRGDGSGFALLLCSGKQAGNVAANYVHHLDAIMIAAADCVAERISVYLIGKEIR